MSFPAPEAHADWFECRPGSPGYPLLLARIAAPPALVVKGRIIPGAPMLAIVGARRCSPYGEELAYEMAMDLAAGGWTVVSGLARGIDAAAHRGALDAGGATIAVMGTGPDMVYPPEHRHLADRVAASGALVTQFPAGTAPARQNFPLRNETISGLCIGVVVVEARRRSGAMLTAGSAANQGRVVMAVPGSVRNPASRGCHDLLRDGASLVTNAAEVGQESQADPLFRLLAAPAAAPSARDSEPAWFGDARDAVLDLLQCGNLTLDQLVTGIALPASDVVTAVARLRLDGDVRLRDGTYGIAASRPSGNKRGTDLVV